MAARAPDENGAEEAHKRTQAGFWLRWSLRALAGLLAAIVALAILIDTPIGHRAVANYVEGLRPQSGLRIKIGEITGSLYGKSEFHRVAIGDPQGDFLHVPIAELDWRPLSWLYSGLDIRSLALRHGRLHRVPAFDSSAPSQLSLPEFDLRIDRLEIDGLEIAKGIAGDMRRIDFLVSGALRDDAVMLAAKGQLGGTDRLALSLDAEPEQDRFDIHLDYVAPAGGLLAGLTGAEEEWIARANGDGNWASWNGSIEMVRSGSQFAEAALTNRAGLFDLKGTIRPAPLLEGLAKRVAGDAPAISARGRFDDRIYTGLLSFKSDAADMQGEGSIDLAGDRFERFAVNLALLDPALFGPALTLEGARLDATLNGPFEALDIDHRLTVDRLAANSIEAQNLAQTGIARPGKQGWQVPLDLSIGKIRSGTEARGAELSATRMNGVLVLAVNDGDAQPWSLKANVKGIAGRLEDTLMQGIAGPQITFSGKLSGGQYGPWRLADGAFTSSRLALAIDAQLDDGDASFTASGRHREYGKFSFQGSMANKNLAATAKFERPYAPAGIEDARISLKSIPGGYALEAASDSMLGPVEGEARLLTARGGQPRLHVDRLNVWDTRVSGEVRFDDGVLLGELDMAGGGLSGQVAFSQGNGKNQAYSADLTMSDLQFGGDGALSITRGTLTANGELMGERSTLDALLDAQGVGYGELYFGRMDARAVLAEGRGTASANLAGYGGSKSALQIRAELTPGQALIAARGRYDGGKITMPRRARLLWNGDGSWSLREAQLDFSDGYLQVEAGAEASGTTHGTLSLSGMPIGILDLGLRQEGLNGTASGKIEWSSHGAEPLEGTMRLDVKRFSRSGLILTSQPVDLALNAKLTASGLQAKANARSEGAQLGQMALRVDDLPDAGTLIERIARGSLSGSVNYSGPASAIWRLAAIDAFDFTGPISIDARMGGTLDGPQIDGSLRGDGLRMQSTITGTDLRNMAVRGSFTGSRLNLTRFSGTAGESGRISGKGTIDLAETLDHAPRIDIRLAAKDARLFDRSDIAATVSGPMRIYSDGRTGTIAGRLSIERADWQLGNADAAEALPLIDYSYAGETNARAIPVRRKANWRYLVDIQADDHLHVEGLGLMSEWSADIRLRGSVQDPRIGGRTNLRRGDFAFAGTRFDIKRGKIEFDEATAPDPILDIQAESLVDELNVQVSVSGNASSPEIAFRSTPGLPEEEIVSRLLFGDGSDGLSTGNALQLGAAVSALRSGGGLGPINGLRGMLGIDRLRLLAPNPSIERETAIAVGKHFTRRLYAELITDGQRYSATQLEFRLTNWLSLFAHTSSIRQNHASLEYRKDY